MNVSKLQIKIVDPAKEVEKNLAKLTLARRRELNWPYGMPNFRNIQKSDGLGRVLLTVMKYPNMSWIHIVNVANLRYGLQDYVLLAQYAGLITNKVPKRYKGSNPGFRITQLGLALLKYNNLI